MNTLYSTTEWKSTRDRFLAMNPLDPYSLTPATQVHHIFPFSDPVVPEPLRPLLLVDTENLISLSRQTHTWIHKKRWTPCISSDFRNFLANRIAYIRLKYNILLLPKIYYRLIC